MIQLRDVIHYYIGQSAQFKLLGSKRSVIAELNHGNVETESHRFEYIKPLLRPLESITDLEAKELHDKLIPGWGQEYPERWHQQEMRSWITAGMRPTLGPQSVFDATHYLLSKGFDLWNFIESGQAPDITKHINNQS